MIGQDGVVISLLCLEWNLEEGYYVQRYWEKKITSGKKVIDKAQQR